MKVIMNFEPEVKKGLITLLDKKTGELALLEAEYQAKRDEIGECMALKVMYEHRVYAKGHNEFKCSIEEEEDKLTELMACFRGKEKDYKYRIDQLRLDINSLNELIKNDEKEP